MAELTGTDLPDVLPAAALPPDAESWDVVVVGFGIAGGCAALEAARAGARVLLLERAAVHGGTSSMSGGHFYLGGGTAVQQATGHDDSADAMYDYLLPSPATPSRTRSAPTATARSSTSTGSRRSASSSSAPSTRRRR